MNIDIAESLMESWLHICMNCQVVQNKWTTSTTWDKIDEEMISKRKEDVIKLVESNKYINTMLGDRNINTIFKQAECDLIGINYNSNEDNYYIVETAFHEKGLHYTKNGDKDNNRVYKKLLIESFIFYIYVVPFINKNINLNLIFASVKANDLVDYENDKNYKIILEFIRNLYSDLEINVNIMIDIIVNDRYKVEIYDPIVLQIKENNINSELFTRSLKLIKLLNSEDKSIKNNEGEIL